MTYIITVIIGFLGGATAIFAWFYTRHQALEAQRRRQASQAQQIETGLQLNKQREVELERAHQDFAVQVAELKAQEDRFNARIVSYTELADENGILKADLFSLAVHVRKTELDCQQQAQAQAAINERSTVLARRYLKDNVKWISSSLNPNNYVNCKKRLQDVIASCRSIGYEITLGEEEDLLGDLKAEYERVVRAAFEREEQARIRAQIREEQAREREIQRELKQADREKQIIQAALDRALAQARDQHSEEVERLKEKLAEAEAKSQRAISQAQLTKAGHVYVISNIGSFGEGIFKVGMTRRLEPLDRICELGDASVPFPFDVHMMISSDDAPTLENAIHRKLHKLRLNKINPRREFFRTTIEAICEIVKEHHGDVEYVADAEALQYRQSLTMTDDDLEFIEHVYDEIEDELPSDADDEIVEECPAAPAS